MKNFWIFILAFLALVSCDDKLNPDSLYTFKETNIAEYFRDNPEFSMFYKFLQISHNTPNKNSSIVASLLGTVGNYTVFAPTNDAMKVYLDSLYGENNYLIDTISRETANRVVLNCVIDMGTYKPLKQINLLEGTINDPTLDDHHLIVHWTDEGSCIINGKGKIISKFDIDLYNGVIHIVDHVLPPAPHTVSGIIAAAKHLRIFNHLLEITSWADSMLLFEDKKYVPVNGGNYKVPKYRLYGYTVFVEADSIFAKDWGVPMPIKDENDGHIVNMKKIMEVITKKCREAYPDATDSDWKSKNNAVNRFISYHLLNIKATYDNLILHFSEGRNYNTQYTVNTWNYFKTRGTNRLIKPTRVVKDSTIYLNRHCGYDNTFLGDYHETYCDYEGVKVYRAKDYLENYASNGYYWLINHVLLYDNYTQNVVLNERIRYDIEQNMPEIYNAGINASFNNPYNYATMTIKNTYCENFITPSNYFISLQNLYNVSGTQIGLKNIVGETIYYKLLPVPYSGNWELRLCSLNSRQLLVRFWIGTTRQVNKMEDLGIIDLTNMFTIKNELGKLESVPIYGEEDFKSDQQLGYDSVACFENDKNLRLHGRMKAPLYCNSARNMRNWQRHIICRKYLEANKEYWIRYQISSGTNPMIDAIEMCPESVYANPNKAEDIW